MPSSEPASVRVARNAMATRFEIMLPGTDAVSLRAAAEEALDEIERLEGQLSLYRETSEVAQLNRQGHLTPVRLSPEVFNLLKQAKQLSTETGGAFDITVAPLLRCWGFLDGSGRMPDPAELAAARNKVGMHLLELDEAGCTASFERPGVMVDLGAIGKGYAIERAATLLRDCGITSALLHGGTSTVYAIGSPTDEPGWRVALELPASEGETPDRLAVVNLKDEALSVSAVWGKSFQSIDKTFGHIIDPRTGEPATGAVYAAIVSKSATETDALSTALLTLGLERHEQIAALRPNLRSVVANIDGETWKIRSHNIDCSQLGALNPD